MIAGADGELTGRWVERDLAWNYTDVLNCPVCGRLITRRAWSFDGGAGVLRVHGPDCEELYESYWKPTHGVMEPDADH
jgi:hypothetical protein